MTIPRNKAITMTPKLWFTLEKLTEKFGANASQVSAACILQVAKTTLTEQEMNEVILKADAYETAKEFSFDKNV